MTFKELASVPFQFIVLLRHDLTAFSQSILWSELYSSMHVQSAIRCMAYWQAERSIRNVNYGIETQSFKEI